MLKLFSDPWMVKCFYSNQGPHHTISAGEYTGFYFSVAVDILCVHVCHGLSYDRWLSGVCLDNCLECPFGISLSALVALYQNTSLAKTTAVLVLGLAIEKGYVHIKI